MWFEQKHQLKGSYELSTLWFLGSETLISGATVFISASWTIVPRAPEYHKLEYVRVSKGENIKY